MDLTQIANPASFSTPKGFGPIVTAMKEAETVSTVSDGFSTPKGFGPIVTYRGVFTMSYEQTIIIGSFSTPKGFGPIVTKVTRYLS